MASVLYKIKNYSICLLIAFLFFSTSIKSQAVYDTLYSFPDTTSFLNEGIIVIDDIVNLAVTYWPDSSWEYYQVEKILFAVPQGIDTTGYSYLYLSIGDLPEDSIIYIEQVFYDIIPLYPDIAVIIFDEPVIINSQTLFYLSGPFINTLSISNWLNFGVPGQYAFWHSSNEWVENLDCYFNLKVVVKKNLTNVEEQSELKKEFSLSQNYPNTFKPSTNIQYSLSSTQFVTLKVYDVLGREVATLVNAEKSAGSYDVDFNSEEALNTTSLPSGIYFYQLRVGDSSTSTGQSFVETKKMILMK